jgi:hypothetical protein
MSAYDYYKFYLKPEDLQGKEHTVKVAKVYPDLFYNPKTRKEERKLVLEFEGKKKAMVLNATQAGMMMYITSTEHERQWIGTEIVLTAATGFNAKQTIRITAVVKAEAEKLFNAPVSRNVPVEA